MRTEEQEALRQIQRRIEPLTSAGRGLQIIGELLGADASEHHMNPDHIEGLAHAVTALGTLIWDSSNEIWGACQPDREKW